MKNKPKSRREFLLNLLSNKVKSNSGLASNVSEGEGQKQKIKMLTPDGKLVEVDSQVVLNSQKSKAANADILKWMEDGREKQ
jgi:hypothetical protein